MYREKTVSLVIPAYNEEKLIVPTLQSVPDLVDRIYVVDDGSNDETRARVTAQGNADPRVQLIEHEKNEGVGQAIISGYLQSSEDCCDIAVVAGGDHQMPLEQIPDLLDPIIDGKAEYAKGNRFLMPDAGLEDMPWSRVLGNSLIFDHDEGVIRILPKSTTLSTALRRYRSELSIWSAGFTPGRATGIPWIFSCA